MLLTQVFKTREGAEKRARFETAHSHAHRYQAVRCVNNLPDGLPFDAGRFCAGDYSWRLERTHRAPSHL